MGIATRADFFTHGLPAEAISARSRPLAAVTAATNTLTLPGHGLAAGTPVRVESTGALPSPLSAGTVYYVLAVVDSDDLIQLAETSGGAAVDLTTAGDADATHSLIVQRGVIVDRVLDAVSSRYVQDLTAHSGPIARDDCPEHLIADICYEAAAEFVVSAGLQREGYADPSIQARAAQARERRARYRGGQPVHGLVDGTPDVADNASVVLLGDVDVAAQDWQNAAGGGAL
jgi:hypothetical protein